VILFAYPNGKPDADYSAVHVRLVRELGFMAAVSTSAGAARADDDLYEMPRFTPWRQTAPGWALQLARNLRTRPKAAA
jgi:hypothetical protein